MNIGIDKNKVNEGSKTTKFDSEQQLTAAHVVNSMLPFLPTDNVVFKVGNKKLFVVGVFDSKDWGSSEQEIVIELKEEKNEANEQEGYSPI
jgi:hypothetical protein